MSKISVIIPCYNSNKYLERCVKNLMAQTIGFENIEIVFVNNDNSIEIDKFIIKVCALSKFAKTIEIVNAPHLGNAWNAGLSVARADYVMFVDSADWMEVNTLERLYSFAQRNSCDIVNCKCTNEIAYKLSPVEASFNDKFIPVTSEKQRELFIASQALGSTIWNNLYRKAYLQENHISFPEGLNYEDLYFLFQNYCYGGRIGIIDEPLYHHGIRITETNATQTTEFMEDFYLVNELKYSYAKRTGLLNAFPEALEYDYILHYYFDGIKLLLGKYKQDPKVTLNFMRRHIRDTFPDFAKNKYFKQYNSQMTVLCLHLLSNQVEDQQLKKIIDIIKTISNKTEKAEEEEEGNEKN